MSLKTSIVSFLIAVSVLAATSRFASATRLNSRLAGSSSPYLREHAKNPVDWYPWGAEAFAAAKAQDKPVILSIGYSGCHWCNLMETESFKDKKISQQMNEHFINVKVDKDQDPDVDFTYQTACQNMTGMSGWPLTMILTPDRKPLMAATYLTPGAFRMVMGSVSKKWKEDRTALIKQADESAQLLSRRNKWEPSRDELAAKSVLDDAFAEVAKSYDPEYGGIAYGSKFPMPTVVELALLRARQDATMKAFVQKTLDLMASEQMKDHVGGGFFRYVSRRNWTHPHFEKLLVDNAQIARDYLLAGTALHNQAYIDEGLQAVQFMLSEFRSPQGTFYNIIGADSEGKEGQFYYWRKPEVLQAVGNSDYQAALQLFNIDSDTLNVPTVKLTATEQKANAKFAALRAKMQQYRATHQVAPQKDTQAIAAHNAAAVLALVAAYRASGDRTYLANAQACMTQWRQAYSKLGKLPRVFGASQPEGYLIDYAMMVRAFLELATIDGTSPWFDTALSLNDRMLKQFYDEKRAIFKYASERREKLPAVAHQPTDTILPSPAAAATMDQILLFRFTADARYQSRARRILSAYEPLYRKKWLHSAFAAAVDALTQPASDVIFVSDVTKPSSAPMAEIVGKAYLPHSLVLMLDIAKIRAARLPLPALTALLQSRMQAPGVYVCTERACRPVITDPASAAKTLSELP